MNWNAVFITSLIFHLLYRLPFSFPFHSDTSNSHFVHLSSFCCYPFVLSSSLLFGLLLLLLFPSSSSCKYLSSSRFTFFSSISRSSSSSSLYRVISLSDKYHLSLPVEHPVVLTYATHPIAHKRAGITAGNDKQQLWDKIRIVYSTHFLLLPPSSASSFNPPILSHSGLKTFLPLSSGKNRISFSSWC